MATQDTPQHSQLQSTPATQFAGAAQAPAGPFALPPLPYEPDALAPYVSAETLALHHGKHHRAYVDKANKLVAESNDPDLKDTVVEHIVVRAARNPGLMELFNNAAQAWNHSFFWQCLTPAGRKKPSAALARKIDADLGGLEGFAKKFADAAAKQFGAGWAWLVMDCGKLKVVTTGNADMPLVHGQIPLLTLDVWEHAYYLDYQNRRPDYIKAVIQNLLNWEFAEANLEHALGKRA
ncbi:MAG: superoxide dismutase [Rhodospirillaceae bacterium]|nr:superoxide dismutase [Rhodospirillaceae bacterium]